MEDGSSLPVLGIIILFLLLWLNGILYGFSAAIRNLSENETVKQALDGNKKAVLLKNCSPEYTQTDAYNCSDGTSAVQRADCLSKRRRDCHRREYQNLRIPR